MGPRGQQPSLPKQQAPEIAEVQKLVSDSKGEEGGDDKPDDRLSSDEKFLLKTPAPPAHLTDVLTCAVFQAVNCDSKRPAAT